MKPEYNYTLNLKYFSAPKLRARRGKLLFLSYLTGFRTRKQTKKYVYQPFVPPIRDIVHIPSSEVTVKTRDCSAF